MATLRQRLAACALALMVCQAGLAMVAPLSSCCPTRPAVKAAAERDCCPAGAHAPGRCPLHGRSKSSKVECRLQCDAPHGAQFLSGTVGMLPAPTPSIAAPIASRTPVSSTLDPETLVFVPDSPPPRA